MKKALEDPSIRTNGFALLVLGLVTPSAVHAFPGAQVVVGAMWAAVAATSTAAVVRFRRA